MAGRHAKKKRVVHDYEDLEVNEGDEKRIQTIHEMINEALIGTNSNNLGSAGDSIYPPRNNGSNGFRTDPETGNLIYTNSEDHVPVTLDRLFSQFQDLDSRLSRVEDIVLKREILFMNTDAGEKRATTLTGSEYPCYGNDLFTSPSRLSDLSTINPILTSSADILSGYSSFPGSSIYSLQSSELASKMKRVNDIRRSDLDNFCLTLLERDPKPSVEQLQEVVNSLSPVYTQFSQKQLLSKVREWFRKRREYMSQRIFQACSDCFKDVKIESEAELNAHISELQGHSQFIEGIMKEANLEIIDNSVAKEYCREKIASYFEGLYRTRNRSR